MRYLKALGLATIILIAIAAMSILAVLAYGWWSQYEASTPNASLTELNDMVYVDIPAKTVHWQVFRTPEELGGVPGPTDYITLVAELAPADKAWFDKHTATTGKVVVTPEAARGWLSPGFRSLLAKHASSSPDIATHASLPPAQRGDDTQRARGRWLRVLVAGKHLAVPDPRRHDGPGVERELMRRRALVTARAFGDDVTASPMPSNRSLDPL